MNEKMCSDEVEKKRQEVIADLLDRMGVDPPEEDEALFARMRNEAATDAESFFSILWNGVSGGSPAMTG